MARPNAHSVESKYLYMTAGENIKKKDWAAGSSVISLSPEWTISSTGAAIFKDIAFPPALIKCMDEALVNAIDHFIRCFEGANPVTEIFVSLDASGKMSVYNNGSGIEIEIHKEATAREGREIYIPTLVFGVLFQGSNHNKTAASDPAAIIGGTNGIGAKICVIHSLEFTVATASNGQCFKQRWTGGIESYEAPTITQYTGPSYTCISWMPDFVSFGYKSGQECAAAITDIIRARVAFAASYVNYAITQPRTGFSSSFDCSRAATPASRAIVKFNDVVMCCADGAKKSISATQNLAQTLFPSLACVVARLSPPGLRPWEIAIVIGTGGAISNVNGIVVRAGKHIDWIKKSIVAAVRAKVATEMGGEDGPPASAIADNIYIIINAQIPHTSWGGQRKDELTNPIATFHPYVIDKATIASIYTQLRDIILNRVLNTRARNSPIAYEKYVDANRAGTKQSSKCALILTEGDAAMASVKNGIGVCGGFEYLGLMCTGGVIMNAWHETREISTATQTKLIMKEQFAKNKFMTAFRQIMGLDVASRYDPATPSYAAEMRALRYGHVDAMVDQDYDGKGNILGLLLTLFQVFWPHLINAGVFRWKATPVIRAIPKKAAGPSRTIFNFYSKRKFDEWALSADTSKYNVCYYKGLGRHEAKDMKNIFEHYEEDIYTFTLDTNAKAMFAAYFGDNADARKEMLSRPPTEISPELEALQNTTHRITCSDHLRFETDAYQRDNLLRKLDSAIDGMNQSSRKIFDGCLTLLRGDAAIKVAAIAAAVTQSHDYQHGEASLCKTVTSKGYFDIGGKQLPQLYPLGVFGSRHKGAKDAAPPRYIYARANSRITSLIYPARDYDLLEFEHDENQQKIEPHHFIPIIPMAVIESTCLPAHGWKLETWGRDALDVIKNIWYLINKYGDNIEKAQYMHMNCYYGDWKGSTRCIGGTPCSIGRYLWYPQTNTIVIVELPFRILTNNYVESLTERMNDEAIAAKEAKSVAKAAAKATQPSLIDETRDDVAPVDADDIVVSDVNIVSIKNTSLPEKLEITIVLAPGAYERMQSYETPYLNGIEKYLRLYKFMNNEINFLGDKKQVIHFDTYAAVISYWYPFRRILYARRIERERIISDLKILFWTNILRYSRDTTLSISGMKRKQMEETIAAAGYARLSRSAIFTPGNILTDQIQPNASGSKASFRYLTSISDYDKAEEETCTIETKLAKLAEERVELERQAGGSFIGAQMWLDELEALKNAIIEGRATKWQYDEFGASVYA